MVPAENARSYLVNLPGKQFTVEGYINARQDDVDILGRVAFENGGATEAVIRSREETR